MRKRLGRVFIAVAFISTTHVADAAAARANLRQAQEPQAAADGASWERYKYPGEEFSVELPGPPFVFETSRLVYGTDFDYEKMTVFGVYAGGAVYMVASFDKPRPSEPLDYFASLIWGGQGLAPTGDLTLGGFPGRGYQPTSGRVAARVFRTKKRVYLFKILTEDSSGPAARRFFDSATLTAKPVGRFASPLPDPVNLPYVPAPSDGAATGPGRGGQFPAPSTPQSVMSPAAPSTAYRAVEVTRKAVIVYKPEPNFTEKARSNNVTGVVRLRAILSSTGKVERIMLVKGLPDGLNEKAARAAQHILFFPAMKDGRAVSQYVVIEYNFNIY